MSEYVFDPHQFFCFLSLKADKSAASTLRNSYDVTTEWRKRNCLQIDPFQKVNQWFLILFEKDTPNTTNNFNIAAN
jgi:hypothetical protein